MMKAYTVQEEMVMMFDELVISPALEAAEAKAAMEEEILRQNLEWLANPADHLPIMH